MWGTRLENSESDRYEYAPVIATKTSCHASQMLLGNREIQDPVVRELIPAEGRAACEQQERYLLDHHWTSRVSTSSQAVCHATSCEQQAARLWHHVPVEAIADGFQLCCTS